MHYNYCVNPTVPPQCIGVKTLANTFAYLAPSDPAQPCINVGDSLNGYMYDASPVKKAVSANSTVDNGINFIAESTVINSAIKLEISF
jgi:hypothetical protein